MAQETLVAVHEIHRCKKPGSKGDKEKGIAPTKPEVQIIKPGTRFVPKDDKERTHLVGSGAARKLTAEEKVGATETVTSTQQDTAPVVKQVADMTVSELDHYVAEKGYDIAGYADMKKAEKISAIQSHEDGGGLV